VTKSIILFANGNAGVFHDSRQVPSLQSNGWLPAYLADLARAGVDPSEYQIIMPNGAVARAFRTKSGWNWEIRP